MTSAGQTDRLSINVLVPDDFVPPEAHSMLVTKLNQIVTNYGLADNGMTDRFFLTANVLVTSKDIVPSTPPRVSQKLDVVLFVGDVIDNKLYGSTSLPVVGVGQNENKAFINAFQKIPVKSKQLESFLYESKDKIVQFYLQNGNSIIEKAEYLAKSGQYDEALQSLLSIPDFCGEISENGREAALEVYKMKIDKGGEALFKKAQSLWSVNQNEAVVAEVLEVLQGVNPDSAFAADSDKLVSQMSNYLNSQKERQEHAKEEQLAKKEAREQQEWEFMMRQYEDQLELQRQQLKDQTSIEKARVEAEKIAAGRVGRIDINKVTKVIKSWAGSKD